MNQQPGWGSPPQVIVVKQGGATEGCFSCLWIGVIGVALLALIGAIVLAVKVLR